MKWLNKVFGSEPHKEEPLDIVQTKPQGSFFSLSFNEICDLEKYSQHLSTVAEDETLTALKLAANPASKALLEGAKIVHDRGSFILKIPKHLKQTSKLLKDKAGNTLTTLVNQKRRFAGKATLVKSSPALTRAGVAAPLIILEAAHMISAHDQMKTLRSMDAKIDGISRHLKNQSLTDLETSYDRSKAIILSSKELTEGKRATLDAVITDLMKFRNHQRMNLLGELKQIKAVKLGPFAKVRTKKAKVEKLKQLNKSTAEKAMGHLQTIRYMHVSLMLQMVISKHLGDLDDFKEHIIPDELQKWQELGKATEQAVQSITHQFPHLKPWRPLLDATTTFEKVWSPDHELDHHQLQEE